eukprot:COSAG01_NODE_20_length_38868_cov_34.606071_5_plen_188_part_00
MLCIAALHIYYLDAAVDRCRGAGLIWAFLGDPCGGCGEHDSCILDGQNPPYCCGCGAHSTGCKLDADGLGHICTCESGYIGEHCADAFTISGATDSDLNGLYTKTAHTCSGTPVYQKGWSDGYVLYSPDWLYWEVSTSDHAISCKWDNSILSKVNCGGAPDGSCRNWREHGRTNPAITVVAVSGGGR